MEILLNSSNDIYTVGFNAASKTITLSGCNNFPLDATSIHEVFDVTANGYFDLTQNQFAWFRSNGLPVFVWGFAALPSSAASSDTLNILLDIPQNQSQLSLQQKQATASAGSPGTFVGGETPSGTVNGTNKVFALANTPFAGTLILQNNFAFLTQGVDYTISGNTITFTVAPANASVLIANYYH